MIAQHLILMLLWAVFGFLHSALCTKKVKQLVLEVMKTPPRVFRASYICFAAVSLLCVLYYNFTITTSRMYDSTILTTFIAATFFLPGFVIMIWSSLAFGKNILTRTASDNAMLHTSGLYSYVRHPLYSATFLFIIGLLIYIPTYANTVTVACIISYTCLAIPLEEKKLINLYGEDYLTYKAKTPALFPYFFKKKREK